MNSMTGYGEFRGACSNKFRVRVEVRSVNNRFLNIKMNLPEMMAGYEDDIEKLIRQYVHRGAINFFLKLSSDNDRKLIINRSMLKDYYKELKNMQVLLGLKESISLKTIINLPGVLEPSVKCDFISNREWHCISMIVKQALVNLVGMRKREGNRLKKTLQKSINKMTLLLKQIKSRTPQVLTHYENSLKERVGHILDDSFRESDKFPNAVNQKKQTGNLEQNIAMEIALFAQRADINEEIQRLNSHFNEFSATLNQKSEIGKKLDFICQEMLREINTIGSKSIDTVITYAVISLKSELEQIKEQ
ncbi:MAG: YicC/YloC family endoribonuclease, partial [Planctomycetota bacterium]